MNAAPRSGRRRRGRSSKLDAKEKPSASHPLKELNRGGSSFFPPPIAASGASKSGCFRFFDSSSKESLAGSKTAPPNARNVAFNSKSAAKAAGARTSQKEDASKSDLEVPSKIGSTKFSKRATTDLRRKRSKKDPSPKIDLEEGRTPLSFGAHAGTSSATPPVQASISPEVPMDGSLVTPACFAAGHVIVGVHDRRKCRPRGILSVGGGRELEIPEFNGGVADPTRVSVTPPPPPPPTGASINWLPSPLGGHRRSSFSSSSKVRVAHRPAEASIDRLFSPVEDEDEIVSGTRNAPDQETTPSSGVMLLRTPTTGDSVSPFSSILERIAKTSKSKHQSAPSLHPKANPQTIFSGLSFRFGSVETPSNSVDLDEGYRWLSEENPGENVEDQNGDIAAAGFGSVEFVFEAEKPAESISMEGNVLAASDDSDWTLSYKNNFI